MGGTLARYEGRNRQLQASKTAILVVDAQNVELAKEVLEKYPEFNTALHSRALPAIADGCSAKTGPGNGIATDNSAREVPDITMHPDDAV